MQEEFDDVFQMTLEEAMNLGHIIYAFESNVVSRVLLIAAR